MFLAEQQSLTLGQSILPELNQQGVYQNLNNLRKKNHPPEHS